jgi:enoyl-CoA hydratase
MGKTITAEEAQEYGLIGRVVDDGTALEKAQEIAGEIASNGPLAVQAVLRSMRETADMSEEEALQKELEIGWPRINSAEAKEGRKAFAKKREPNFSGVPQDSE